MATKITVNDSDNGFLPDSTKPLPEPMLSQNYQHPSQYNITENAWYAGKNYHMKSNFMYLPGDNAFNSLSLSDAYMHQQTIIGSDNGLAPGATKPLSEPMLEHC